MCTLNEDPLIGGRDKDEFLLYWVYSEDMSKHLTFSAYYSIIIEPSPFSFSNNPKFISQSITGFDTPLIIEVKENISDEECPILYYQPDDETKFINDCTITNKIAYYYFSNEIPNGEYSIYYKTPCSDEKTASNIHVDVNINSIRVTDIKFNDDSACTTNENNPIVITTEISPTGNINNIVLKNIGENTKYIFTSCSYVENSITCTNPSESLIGGKYQLDSIKGNLRFDISSVSSTTLIVDILGKQKVTSQLYRESDIPFFVIILASSTVDIIPEIYLDSNGVNKVTCIRNESELTQLKCSPSPENMETEGEYEVYYKGICGQIINTGIKVEKINDSQEVFHLLELTHFISDTPTCSRSSTIDFLLTFTTAPDSSMTSFNIKLIDNNDMSITETECINKNEATPPHFECSPPESSQSGYHSYSIISAEYENFKFDFITQTKNSILEYDNNILSSYISPYQQGFSKFSQKSLIIELAEPLNTPITIYKLRSESKELDCKYKYKTIICYPNYDEIYNTNWDLFSLNYFPGRCGLIDTLPFRTRKLDNTFFVTTLLSIQTDSDSFCSITPPQTLTLTLMNELPDAIYYISIRLETNKKSKRYECSFTGNVITCNIALTLEINEYYLTDIYLEYSGDLFYFIDINTDTNRIIKVVPTTSPISTTQNSKQIVDNTVKTFTVNLDENSQTTPSIYLGNDKNNIVSCNREGNVLTCNPDWRNLQKSKDYEVYYSDYCDNLLKSDIVISNKIAINAIGISLR